MAAAKEPNKPVSNPSWLTHTVFGIGLASLFSDMSHETVTSVLPALLASMGVAAGILGTIEGLADGLSSVAKLYGGWLSDRLPKRKPLCAVGYAFMALAPVIIALAVNWWLVLFGRVLAWISRGIRTPARKALLAEAVTPEAYGRSFGFERAMDTTGAILAPLIVLGLLGIGLSHKRIIFLSVFPALLAAFAIIWYVKERTGRKPAQTPFLRSLGGFNREFKEFLFAAGLFGLGDFADTFYILYAVQVLTPDLGSTEAATVSVALYVVHNILYASWSYGGGWLADRMNKRFLLVTGYLCAAMASLCMCIGVRGLLGLALVFALGGTAVGLYEAVEDATAAGLLPNESRGRGFGAFSVVTGLGDLVSSLTVGWLWTALGVKAATGAAACVMVAGAVFMCHLAIKRNHTPLLDGGGNTS